MKEVSICFNYSEAKDYDSYVSRMALFSGTSKKYSVNYVTTFQEKIADKMKEYLEKCGCKEFPESLQKIIEAKKNEASGYYFFNIFIIKMMTKRLFMMSHLTKSKRKSIVSNFLEELKKAIHPNKSNFYKKKLNL